ncbi:MAG: hypothetical protein WCK10_03420, partial [Candidatus Staskawiczbacteria bacterium]
GNTVIDKAVNGIHIFINDKFENILVIINMKIPIDTAYPYINLNNVPVFGEKFGLYTAHTLSTGNTYGKNMCSAGHFRPEILTAANFLEALTDLNNVNDFESGLTYYYINPLGQSGSTGPINVFQEQNSMMTVSGWTKNFPPVILTTNVPQVLETKRQSYNVTPIKGPATNIYDKYFTFYDDQTKKSVSVTEPLAREINQNYYTNNKNTVYSANSITNSVNLIYRYNGAYEPIFKDIPLFDCANIYNSVYSGHTKLSYWESNYKFDTLVQNFGNIEEVVFSKINPKSVPLKLKNTDQDRSIYPMVDEYGYQYSSRFIFSSSWDRDFYVLTNADQAVRAVFAQSVSTNNQQQVQGGASAQ